MSKFFEIVTDELVAKTCLEILPNAHLDEIYIRIPGVTNPVIYEKFETDSRYNFAEYAGRSGDVPTDYCRISVIKYSFARTITVNGKPKLFLDAQMLNDIDATLARSAYGKFIFYNFTANVEILGYNKSCNVRLKIYYGEKRV